MFEEVSDEYILTRNYRLIDPDDTLWFVRRLDYNRLMASVEEEIPSGLFKKFTNVEVCAKRAVQNANHFLWFLQNLGHSLKKLTLDGAQLDQEFYDRLPSAARSLVDLVIGSVDDENELQLNFDFIGKLPRLSFIQIHPSLPIESLSSLTRCSDKLTEVKFNFRWKELLFKAEKFHLSIPRGLWAIYHSNNTTLKLKTTNPDEIIKYFVAITEKTD